MVKNPPLSFAPLHWIRTHSLGGAIAISSLFLAACTSVVEPQNAPHAAQPNANAIQQCATAQQRQDIADYYLNTRPGAPTPIPGRNLKLPEGTVTAGLPDGYAVGTPAKPELFPEIWAIFDTWDTSTPLGLVITNGGWNPYNFPIHVPTTRPNPPENFFSVWSAGGDGIHLHINRDDVHSAYAAKLPGKDGSYTRMLSFYANDGNLLFGLYASEAGKPTNSAAVSGFEDIWNLIASKPQLCLGA